MTKNQALTASGDNRYARIEEAAKVISKDVKCVDDDSIPDDFAGVCPSHWKCKDCPLDKLTAALGEMVSDESLLVQRRSK